MIRTDVVTIAVLAASASLLLAPAEAARLPIVEPAPLARQVLTAENRPLIQRDEPSDRTQVNKRLLDIFSDLGDALPSSAAEALSSIAAAAGGTSTAPSAAQSSQASLAKDKDSDKGSKDGKSGKGSDDGKSSNSGKGSKSSDSDNPDAIASAVTQAGTSSPTVSNQSGVESVTKDSSGSSSAAKATSTGSKKSKDSSSGSAGDDKQVAAAASGATSSASASQASATSSATDSSDADADADDEECDDEDEEDDSDDTASSSSAPAAAASATTTKAAKAKAASQHTGAASDSASHTWTWVAGALGCPDGQKPRGTAHLCTATSFAAGKPNTSTASASAAASGSASSAAAPAASKEANAGAGTQSGSQSAASPSSTAKGKSKKKKACKSSKAKATSTAAAAASADATNSAANQSAASNSASGSASSATAAAQAGSDSGSGSGSAASSSASTLSASGSTASLSPAATSASVQSGSSGSSGPTQDVPRISIPKITNNDGNDNSRVMMPMRRAGADTPRSHLVKSLKATIKSMKKVAAGVRKMGAQKQQQHQQQEQAHAHSDAGSAPPAPAHHQLDAHLDAAHAATTSAWRFPITHANEHALLAPLTVTLFLGSFLLPAGALFAVRRHPSTRTYLSVLAGCMALSFLALHALRNTLAHLGALDEVERGMAFELVGSDEVARDVQVYGEQGHLQHRVIIGRERVEFAWTYFFVGLMQLAMGLAIRQGSASAGGAYGPYACSEGGVVLTGDGDGNGRARRPRFAWARYDAQGRFVVPVLSVDAEVDEKAPLPPYEHVHGHEYDDAGAEADDERE